MNLSQIRDDLVALNTYYSNGQGGQGTAQPATRPRELHLTHSLVPSTDDRPPPMTHGPLSSSPPGRFSAIRLEDLSSSPGSTVRSPSMASLSPSVPSPPPSSQRVYIDGRWRLRSSLSGGAESTPAKLRSSFSSPNLPSRKPYVTSGRQPVPSIDERLLQDDNRRLADTRTQTQQRNKQNNAATELSTLGEWPARWGYPSTSHKDDLPSRRRIDPTFSQPTLVGFHGLGL